jgi:hypothetical protein
MWRKGFVLSATFFSLILLTEACKKKEFPIGENSISGEELLASGAVDTFSLETYSILKDSTISSSTLFGMLGSYNDPDFGIFQSEIYTQLRLSGFDPYFGDLTSITVDSLVLALEYGGHYGNKGTQTVEVYELNEDIYKDTTYYTFSEKTVKTNFGSNGGDLVRPGYNTLDFDVNKETIVGSDTLKGNQLRIHLHPSIGKRLVVDANSGAGNFSSNEAFLEYFKGLKIKVTNSSPAPGDGGIFYFKLTDPDSKMILYYRDNGVPRTFDFLINSSCAYFNHVDITNTSEVTLAIDDESYGNDAFYAQACGVRGAIRIPGLSNIPKTAVIHKAVLELPVEYHYSSPYTPGLGISISTVLEENSDDLYAVGTASYSDISKSMKADIRAYVQSVVSGELENTHLVVSAGFHNTSADRIIFNGPGSSNKFKPKLYILYTEF